MRLEKFVLRSIMNPDKQLQSYGDLRFTILRALKEENKELSRIISFYKKDRSRNFQLGSVENARKQDSTLKQYTAAYISNHLIYNALRGCDMDKVHAGDLSFRQRDNLRDLWGRLGIHRVNAPTLKIKRSLTQLFEWMNKSETIDWSMYNITPPLTSLQKPEEPRSFLNKIINFFVDAEG